MIGFIKGLFGSKAKEATVETNEVAAPAPQKPKAYFLDADDAKTFGNIDYMRSSKVVKRTFPKTKGNQGEFEIAQQVSALAAIKLAEESAEAVKEVVKAEMKVVVSAPQPSPEVVERRSVDTNIDMFRKMARDINKK